MDAANRTEGDSMNTHDFIAQQLRTYATGPTSSVLMSIATVQVHAGGEWLDEASGSSVEWLAAQADDSADYGDVRVVTHYGAVLAASWTDVTKASV